MSVDDEELARFRLWEKNAMLFLRAGGVFSFEEWSKFPPKLQAACASAGDKVAARNAALAAIAGLSEEHAIAILSIFDDGKIKSDVALARGVREMVGLMKGLAR